MNIIIRWPWQLRLVTVTSVFYVHSPPQHSEPWQRTNRIEQSVLDFQNLSLYSISTKNPFFFHYKCFLWPILFNIWKIQSWTKMLRKIHLVCLILEYFTLKTGTLKILPPPPKNNVEGSPEHFWSRLNNTDQGGVGGGATMMLNSLGVSPVHNKVWNS